MRTSVCGSVSCIGGVQELGPERAVHVDSGAGAGGTATVSSLALTRPVSRGDRVLPPLGQTQQQQSARRQQEEAKELSSQPLSARSRPLSLGSPLPLQQTAAALRAGSAGGISEVTQAWASPKGAVAVQSS